MNQLTAIRNFAAPGFTPTRHVRIFADRWYLVTMQNVERDPRCDYIGLGEGEYVELLPGNKARERRDAHLNHCNRIVEHNGSVFEAFASQYGGEMRSIGWFVSSNAAFNAVTQKRDDHNKWIADCLEEASHQFRLADAVEAGEAKSIMTATHLRESGNECLTVADEHKDGFRCDVRKVR